MRRFILAMALATMATPALAREYTVSMVSDPEAKTPYRFSPSELTIEPGDTVTFVNAQDDMHNVMVDRAPKGVSKMIMSPMLEKEADTWSYTFTAPGTYGFHCHPHEALGMTGTIIVGKASTPGETPAMAHDHGGGGSHESGGQ